MSTRSNVRPRETWSAIWRRRLQLAVDASNLALRAGDHEGHINMREKALRAASMLRRLPDAS